MNQIVQTETRDNILHLLNITLLKVELKMTIENDNNMHNFANAVFFEMLKKLASQQKE